MNLVLSGYIIIQVLKNGPHQKSKNLFFNKKAFVSLINRIIIVNKKQKIIKEIFKTTKTSLF